MKPYRFLFLTVQRLTQLSPNPRLAAILVMSLLQFFNLLVICRILAVLTNSELLRQRPPRLYTAALLFLLILGNYWALRDTEERSSHPPHYSHSAVGTFGVAVYVIASIVLVFWVPFVLR